MLKSIAFGRLGLSYNDFKIMTHVEILRAEKARIEMWHLQNAVNASFFTGVLQSIGSKTETGEPIKREHLYLLPGEELPESKLLDPYSEKGMKEINELISKYG